MRRTEADMPFIRTTTNKELSQKVKVKLRELYGKLIEKKNVSLPAELKNVIFCKNPRCITTTEQELPHVFKLTDESNKIYRCIYCETKAE